MIFLVITLVCGFVDLSVSTERPNVLFLMMDDLRPNLEFLRGDPLNGFMSPRMHTPNLDALARKSLVLKQAFVQQAICAPSRSSMLTGRRPDTTHVYGFKNYWRESGGNFTTLPQYFKENGYISAGIGKIFHQGKSSKNNDPISWSEPYFEGKFNFESNKNSWNAIPDHKLEKKPLIDEQLADEAIKRLKMFAAFKDQPDAKPFFLAVGFHKPHLPFVFPESMLEKYPMEDIMLPENPYVPVDMPKIAGHGNGNLFRGYRDLKAMNIPIGINTTRPSGLVTKQLRRAYYCALSWADSQLGRILSELDLLGLSDNTIIAFLSDHGYSLGEQGMWTKFTNFEIAVRAPLMLHIPHVTDRMIQTKQLVEFVDVFPTLVEAAGLDPLPICPEISSKVKVCREGMSFMPLIETPDLPIKRGAFSQEKRKRNIMGYSVRTTRYRYTEWVKFSNKKFVPKWRKSVGEELYDHFLDSQENKNVAAHMAYTVVKQKLKRLLHEGWRDALYPAGLSIPDTLFIDSELTGPEIEVAI